jgi:glycosyltransferase involved in cell wall biosynthesis
MAKRRPSLSVVTPSYQQGRFIERTIRSVLGQGAADVEYMVVDGGSTDDTGAVLARYADRLRYVSEPDRGQAHAVNKGILATSGEVIGWLNSDDVYYAGALEAVVDRFAADPEIDVLYGDADHIDPVDQVLEPYYTEPWNAERLRDICFLCQPAVFFHRRVVDECGLLDESLRFCMDYEYWLRLAAAGRRFSYLERRLAGSRMYPENKTLGQRLAVHTEMNQMLKRRLGAVPDRWLANWAHARLGSQAIDRESRPLSYARRAAAAAWWASIRWNRSVSPRLRSTTRSWLEDGRRRQTMASRAAPPERPEGSRSVRESGPLDIAFDVSQAWGEKAGCGHAAEGMIRALAEVDERNRYQLLATFGADTWDSAAAETVGRFGLASEREGPAVASRAEAAARWSAPAGELEAWLGWPDIVHSNNFFCPSTLARARLVYTLHDLAFLDHPEWTTEANWLTCFRGVLGASCHADLILAVSEATRAHFLTTFPYYPPERVLVVHNGNRFASATPDGRAPEGRQLEADRFFLSVGTIEPRKNHPRLLRAYAAYARDAERPLPLVLAGGRGWLTEGFDRELAATGLNGLVVHLGYVDDGVLLWLYRNCRALLYPSSFEGFGLPVVEAMSQGAAVLTSRGSALAEIAGEAALLVDPNREEEISAEIRRLATDDDLRRRFGALGRHHAERFSWRAAAEATLRAYELAMRLPKLHGA